MNILVVDDDRTSRTVLSATLKMLGHQVSVASSGTEAMAIFENEHVPVIISDMVMTGVDGLELCRRIRASKRAEYTYIILLTSVAGKNGYLVGMRAGADDFLAKPCDEAMLSARLHVAERLLNLQFQARPVRDLPITQPPGEIVWTH